MLSPDAVPGADLSSILDRSRDISRFGILPPRDSRDGIGTEPKRDESG